jgi:hypothetical protein
MACAKISGVEILNEGSGVAIDDAFTDMQAIFVARAVETMTAVASLYMPAASSIFDT